MSVGPNTLKGNRNAKDQCLRASQAMALNIAEGNGNATNEDRRRYFDIARGSALECEQRLGVADLGELMTPPLRERSWRTRGFEQR